MQCLLFVQNSELENFAEELSRLPDDRGSLALDEAEKAAIVAYVGNKNHDPVDAISGLRKLSYHLFAAAVLGRVLNHRGFIRQTVMYVLKTHIADFERRLDNHLALKFSAEEIQRLRLYVESGETVVPIEIAKLLSRVSHVVAYALIARGEIYSEGVTSAS